MYPLAPAAITIEDGVVRSDQYGDVYFSASGGLDETRHVFHSSIGLNDRWAGRAHYTIAETGFGTGLNFLATWQAFDADSNAPTLLHYISSERHPITVDDLRQCHALFPELEKFSVQLLARYPTMVSGIHRLWLVPGKVCLTLCLMDAVSVFEQLEASVDCWFLDGFAPARNADMWDSAILRGIGRLSAPSACFATFTAAGDVRRGLSAQGFTVEKIQGFGAKREMLIGELTDPPQIRSLTPWFQPPDTVHRDKRALVIGAGIAGAQVAWHLAVRGWQVTVHERHQQPATEASGNPAAILSPRLTAAPSIAESFSCAAWTYQLRQLNILGSENCGFIRCGAVQLAWNPQKTTQWHAIKQRRLPASFVSCLERSAASQIAGIDLADHALYFPEAGWVSPTRLISTLLQHPNIRTQYGSTVTALDHQSGQWQLADDNGGAVDDAPVTIIATGSSLDFAQSQALASTPVRGQTSWLSESASSRTLKTIVQHEGYLLPSVNGRHLIGATYDRNNAHIGHAPRSDDVNLKQLAAHIPSLDSNFDQLQTAHTAIRMTSHNRQPYVGPIPDQQLLAENYQAMHRRDFSINGTAALAFPGLFISGAHGSRGFTNAALCAELLASLINSEPLPLSKPVYHALHPARQLIKKLQRR